MGNLGEAFSTDDLPTSGGYDLLPDGWYNATIVKADLNNTKAGTGQKIDIRYDITGPTHQGRVMFGSLNIRNPNTKAEEIGRQQLGDLMRAIGLAKVEDTEQLVGGNVQIKVKTKPGDGQYEARNEVGGWKSAGGSAPMPSSTPAPQTEGKAPPPWAKK